MAARIAVAAKREVSIAGVWNGEADLSDPWAVRALFLELLDDGTAVFEGAEPPDLAAGDEPGVVY